MAEVVADEDVRGRDERLSLYNRLKRYLIFIKRSLKTEKTRKLALQTLAFTLLSLVGAYNRRKMTGYCKKSMLRRSPAYYKATDAPLSQLLRDVGSLDRVLFGPSIVYYLSGNTWRKSLLPRDNPNFERELFHNLAPICDVAALPESLSSRLASPALATLPFVYLYFVYRMMNNQMSGGDVAKSYNSKKDASAVDTTFADVAGIDDVVQEVAEVVDYLKDPTQFSAVGARSPRGILLYGPPGSGKTLLARAMAGEAQVDAFISCSASDFVEMYVGRGAARVRGIFDKARKQARSTGRLSFFWRKLLRPASLSPRKKPTAVLFIDELDALAKTRSTFSSNDEREQTLNQLLTEMDGFYQHSDVTLVVVAATNRADILDPAIQRRFERQVMVKYPDATGRQAILKIHARNIQIDNDGKHIDWPVLGSDNMTGNFSGADLRNMANEAALLAVRDEQSTVNQTHLERAALRIKQSKESISMEQMPSLPLGLLSLVD